MVVSRNETVHIVGGGCFDLSTAYHLLQKSFTDVTVLDRLEKLPAPDAASTDMNKSEQTYNFLCAPKNDSKSFGPATFKVVRTSYSDIFYSQLARDATQ